MSAETLYHQQSNRGVTWEIPCRFSPETKDLDRTYRGAIVVDLDGTLTIPNSEYDLEKKAVEALAKFRIGGGDLIICTGAIRDRVQKTILKDLYDTMSIQVGIEKVRELFEDIFLLPENGSVLLINKGVWIEEGKLKFRWHRLHELHVPDKDKLRVLLESELVPNYLNSYVAGDQLGDQVQREYILSWKGLSDVLKLKRFIEEIIRPKYQNIDWANIRIETTQTAVNFVHADSGKSFSVAWLFKEIEKFNGPVIGFGDLGDEFASVIPTFNVNKKNPNAFRERGQSAMDLSGKWVLLKQDRYVLIDKDNNTKVLSRKTGREIQVLRSEGGKVIFASETEKGYLVPTDIEKGFPVEIKPFTLKKGDQTIQVENAGRGTAWMMNYLMDIGYFK